MKNSRTSCVKVEERLTTVLPVLSTSVNHTGHRSLLFLTILELNSLICQGSCDITEDKRGNKRSAIEWSS